MGGTGAGPATDEPLTFLSTEIEGGTAQWEEQPRAMIRAVARHDQLLTSAIEAAGGRVFHRTGHGVCAVFAQPARALDAALAAQLALLAEDWEPLEAIRARMAIHTGEAEQRDDHFAGAAVDRVARIRNLARGGEVLVSSAAGLGAGRLAGDVELVSLGEVELGGTQSPETLYRLTHPSLPADFAPLGGGRRSVPGEDGRLVGRDDDIDAVLRAFDESRLVTLIGVGGVGKTRLALAFANRPDERFSRAWWVDLVVAGTDLVVHAVANAVGGTRQGVDLLEAVVERLETAGGLLVLDNCEHVIGPVKALIEPLLARCPDLRVLATSRTPLRMSAERVVELTPLDVPAVDAEFSAIAASPSVLVFTDRALKARADFELRTQEASAVGEICRRLDGLPLAIELAAARVGSISPANIAALLDERFALLSSRQRDVSGRRRNLDDAVRWSHDLLAEDERRFFDQMSVFAGSFDTEAAGAVADLEPAPTAGLLQELADKSLLVAVAQDGRQRYCLLETLRQFGQRSLDHRGDDAAAVERHRLHYLGVAERAGAGLRTPDEAAWVQQVHADMPNLGVAFARAADAGDVDTCIRMTVALVDYAFWRMRPEVGAWADEALALPGSAAHPRYGRAAAAAALLAWLRGSVAEAVGYATTAMETAPDSHAYEAYAMVELYQGRAASAVDVWERSLALAIDARDDVQIAIASNSLTFAHALSGTGDLIALAHAGQLAAARSSNPTAIAATAWSMGVALFDADPAAALDELARATELAREVDNRLALGAASVMAEELRTKVGSRTVLDDLRAALDQLDYWLGEGNPTNIWGTVRRVARSLAALGRADLAAVAIGAEQAAPLKLPLRRREEQLHNAVVAEVTDELGPAEFSRHTARGAGLGPADLVQELRAGLPADG
jgi:predicted ATPase/class 3 adenylate cyclase